MEEERQVYVVTIYKGNLENQLGVFLDFDKLKEKIHELFMKELTQALAKAGITATAEEMVAAADKNNFGFTSFGGDVHFWFDYYPNGVCCRIGEDWELNVDILPLLD